MTADRKQRSIEILAFAATEGIDLPMLPEQIVALEDAGFVVDLSTGQIIDRSSDEPINLQPATEQAQARWN